MLFRSFNEVDSLLLCELSYINFQGLVPPDAETVSIQEVAEHYYAEHTPEEFLEKKNVTQKASLLLADVVKSVRFKDMTMSNYLNENDPERNIQISAVTFSLADGTTYAAFRGTDGTIVGWKEDFHFTFLNETPGQKRAVQYLNEIQDTGLLRVGGHSKGGNLALFAACYLSDAVLEQVESIYLLDGPGLCPEVMDTGCIRRIDGSNGLSKTI